MSMPPVEAPVTSQQRVNLRRGNAGEPLHRQVGQGHSQQRADKEFPAHALDADQEQRHVDQHRPHGHAAKAGQVEQQLSDTGYAAHVDVVGLQKQVEGQAEHAAANDHQHQVFHAPKYQLFLH